MKYKILLFFFNSFFVCLSSFLYAQNNDSIRAANWPKHPQDIKKIGVLGSESIKTKAASFRVMGFVKLLATGKKSFDFH